MDNDSLKEIKPRQIYGLITGEAFQDSQIKTRRMVIEPEGVKGMRGLWVFSDADLALDRTYPAGRIKKVGPWADQFLGKKLPAPQLRRRLFS